MSLRDEVPFHRPGAIAGAGDRTRRGSRRQRRTAQTVIVQSAPAGAAIELMLSGYERRLATADANGDATLSTGARPDSDVLIFVDSCPARVRVQLAVRGVQPEQTLAGARGSTPEACSSCGRSRHS